MYGKRLLYKAAPERKLDMSKYTDAQRLSAEKWDAKNMKTIGCKIKKEDAERFQQYCDKQNRTVNSVLKDFIFQCIDEDTLNIEYIQY